MDRQARTQAAPAEAAARSRWMLRRMLCIRRFEEAVVDLYRAGEIYGHVHVSIGQEAVPVGVAANLERSDVITSTHRGHGHCLAKGADPARMMAELFGRATGTCKGKGGSMHVADFSQGVLGANGVVAAGTPHAVGAALAMRRLGKAGVSVAFFGEGALNQGVLWESINLASIWRLPVVFVCENNRYAITTPYGYATGGDSVARARGFGLYAVEVDGMDVRAVDEATVEACRRARVGEGPAFLNCLTYRYRGHTEGEEVLGWRYREEDELAAWRQKDPIRHFKQHILESGVLGATEVEAIEAEVKAEIEAAVAFARSSPEPSVDAVYEDLWVTG